MPKLTIDELRKIREKARGDRILSADGPYTAKVTVHMGTCGIAAGARQIMETFIEEIEKKDIKDIYLTTSGCAGLCSHEPMITVELANSIPVKSASTNTERLPFHQSSANKPCSPGFCWAALRSSNWCKSTPFSLASSR